MYRTRHLATALAIAALAVAAPIATASAAITTAARPASPPQTLTLGGPGGAPVPAGDTLSATLQSSSLTLLTSIAGPGLTCSASAWKGSLAANPSGPSPAVITLLPSLFTISGCTDNNPGVTAVTSVTVSGLPESLLIFGSTYIAQIQPPGGPLTITENLVTGGGSPTICMYQAIPGTNGNFASGSGPLTFTYQPFHQLTTLPACGAATAYVALFSATYSPLTDNSAGGTSVYVN
jgi:hypothetical protein